MGRSNPGAGARHRFQARRVLALAACFVRLFALVFGLAGATWHEGQKAEVLLERTNLLSVAPQRGQGVPALP